MAFADICFKNFGDKVKHWMTINEPNLFAQFGYLYGQYPPARCSHPFGNCSYGNSVTEPLIVMHNLLLAHGKTVKLYRDKYQVRNSIFIISTFFLNRRHGRSVKAVAFFTGTTRRSSRSHRKLQRFRTVN